MFDLGRRRPCLEVEQPERRVFECIAPWEWACPMGRVVLAASDGELGGELNGLQEDGARPWPVKTSQHRAARRYAAKWGARLSGLGLCASTHVLSPGPRHNSSFLVAVPRSPERRRRAMYARLSRRGAGRTGGGRTVKKCTLTCHVGEGGTARVCADTARVSLRVRTKNSRPRLLAREDACHESRVSRS